MAVRIRLKRMGRKNRPFYRIVAMNAQSKRDGEELEVLGHYDPLVAEPEKKVGLKRDRIQYWLSVGAQPTDTVSNILKKAGIRKA